MVNELIIRQGGQLDLGRASLAIDYTGGSPIGGWSGSGYTGVSGAIFSGINEGAWDGPGIVTTATAGRALVGVGVAEAIDALYLSEGETEQWNGLTVNATSVLIKATYVGDANVDGRIDADDYSHIDHYYRVRGSRGYVKGDFNLDGAIDADDYSYIDVNWRAQRSPF